MDLNVIAKEKLNNLAAICRENPKYYEQYNQRFRNFLNDSKAFFDDAPNVITYINFLLKCNPCKVQTELKSVIYDIINMIHITGDNNNYSKLIDKIFAFMDREISIYKKKDKKKLYLLSIPLLTVILFIIYNMVK